MAQEGAMGKGGKKEKTHLKGERKAGNEFKTSALILSVFVTKISDQSESSTCDLITAAL